ncbi:hypothetical protein Tco_0428448 [Tanacetum coccineum]
MGLLSSHSSLYASEPLRVREEKSKHCRDMVRSMMCQNYLQSPFGIMPENAARILNWFHLEGDKTTIRSVVMKLEEIQEEDNMPLWDLGEHANYRAWHCGSESRNA